MTPKKDPKDYLKVGRPTLYNPEYCEQAVELLDQGKSRIELCRHFRVAKSTLQEWEANHPEFSAALNRGTDYSEAVWTQMGHQNLTNKDFNSRLYEINMMNRFGWMKKAQEKHEVKISQEDSLKELE